MRYFSRVALVLVFSMLAMAPLAHAQKRVALVIGNSAYQHTGKLANPKNDASDMTAALKKHGFHVIEGLDLDKAAFDRRVRDFSAALKGAEAGLFFYAGHGLQVAGHNYLVPVDAKAETEDALDWEMLKVDVVHRAMERSTSTNILFLDACRDNPLARNLARAMGTRSSFVGRGLATIESGVGTLISFSTQPGNVALDGSGRNSPFAGSLVKYISTSNDGLSDILVSVRNDVMKETQRKQVPWEHSALTGRFYFSAPPAPAVAVLAPTYSAAADAARVCREVEGMASLSLLAVLANQHKGTPAGDCIAARVDELKKIAAATPPPAAKPAPAPEVKPAVQVTPAPTLAPGTTFRDCPDCPEMVVVPAGSFTMGSLPGEEGRFDDEVPQRKVTFAKAFAVGKFEVTFAEWDACVTARGCKRNPGDQGWGRGKRPVIDVSWDHITKEYLPWLSRKTGKTYRLLSEAEWEYAARAGTTTPFSTGRTITPEQANFNGEYTYGGSAKGQYRGKTIDVGSFQANAFGLYDMHGNVWEWVQDCWNSSYQGAPTDSSAWTTGDCSLRVLRGGSWRSGPGDLRSAVRYRFTAVNGNYVGFRLARTFSP